MKIPNDLLMQIKNKNLIIQCSPSAIAQFFNYAGTHDTLYRKSELGLGFELVGSRLLNDEDGEYPAAKHLFGGIQYANDIVGGMYLLVGGGRNLAQYAPDAFPSLWRLMAHCFTLYHCLQFAANREIQKHGLDGTKSPEDPTGPLTRRSGYSAPKKVIQSNALIAKHFDPDIMMEDTASLVTQANRELQTYLAQHFITRPTREQIRNIDYNNPSDQDKATIELVRVFDLGDALSALEKWMPQHSSQPMLSCRRIDKDHHR